MCGIAGLISLDRSPVEADVLSRMAAALAHRGPDEQTVWVDPERPWAGLAHARLVVLDREGGGQPMAQVGQPGRRVVFNGEIYNHRELRAAMEQRGHRFASDHSDTEVLLPLYHEHGPDMVDRLRGMFAFAVYDGPGRRLLLARDRMGQKPLYWTRTARHLAFASELKALLLVPGAARQIDLEGLHLYLQLGYVPSPRTIYRGVWKLPPAARLVVPLDGVPRELAPQTYWSLPQSQSTASSLRSRSDRFGGVGRRAPTDGLITELREVLAEAVRLRLEADVPLGFFLSGGLDSSLVVALARQAEPRRPLRTFCMSFADARYDEARYAALVARRLRTEHARLIVRPSTLEELLPTIVAAFDEPFADSSALPTWLLAREARRHVTVALSGDGGDELFGGYDRYRAVRLAALLDRAGPLKALVRVGGRLVPRGRDLKSRASRWRRFTDALGLAPLERYARWVAPFHEPELLELYSARLREAAAPAALEYLRTHLAPGGDFLDAVMALDARTYLPEDVLVKVDRMTMAHGLEVRSPLLDHKVVEFAMGLPAQVKLGGRALAGRQKILLRQAAYELLPRRILRRGKMGFGVPVSAWLAGPAARFVRERLFDGPLADSGLVAGDVLARYVDEHILTECDHGPRLYSLLVLDEFLRRSHAKLSL